MLGLVVIIAISWLILWLVEKKHLAALGVVPTAERIKQCLVGMVFMAICCAINLVGQAYFKDGSYIRNPDYGLSQALDGVWWTLKAALFEEMIFRGALLYLLIRFMGVTKACIIGAIAFGIYHWFSYEMFGRGFIPMAYVFILTGASGWMFSYAFARTKSLYAPFGLHFGWIVMSIVVFSAGPLGDSMFILEAEETELGGWAQLMFFSWQTFIIPGLVTWYLFKRYSG